MEKMREDSTGCSFFPSTSEIKYQTVNIVQICYVHRIVGAKLWLRKWIKQIVYFIYRAPLQIVMWFTSTDFVTKTKNNIYDDTQTHTHNYWWLRREFGDENRTYQYYKIYQQDDQHHFWNFEQFSIECPVDRQLNMNKKLF